MRDGKLTADIVDFVESGVSILVGTRNAQLRPIGTRAMGARTKGDRVTIFVPTITSERTLANLRDNGAIAVTFTRPSDHLSIQLKGRFVSSREASAEDLLLQQQYRAAFMEQLYVVGVARAASKQYAYTPAIAIDFDVDSVFQQTPGPGAGACLR